MILIGTHLGLEIEYSQIKKIASDKKIAHFAEIRHVLGITYYDRRALDHHIL